MCFVTYHSYVQNVRPFPSFEGSYMLTLDESSEQSKETIPSLRSHSLYQKIKDLWRNSRRDKKCEATTADSDRYHLTHREPREDFGDSSLIDFDILYKFSDSDYSLPPLDHALQLTIFPS